MEMTIGHNRALSWLSFPVAHSKLNCQKRTEVCTGVSQTHIIIESRRKSLKIIHLVQGPSNSTVNPGLCSAGF